MSARSSPSLGSRIKTDASEDVAAVSEDAPEAAAVRLLLLVAAPESAPEAAEAEAAGAKKDAATQECHLTRVMSPCSSINVELEMLFNELAQTSLGKQARELSINLLLRASRLRNLFTIDRGWGEGAAVSPQAQAYQIRRALPVSGGNILKFSCNHRARGCSTLIYRQRLVRRRRVRVHHATDIVKQVFYWHVPVCRAKDPIGETNLVGTQEREDEETNILACCVLGGCKSCG